MDALVLGFDRTFRLDVLLDSFTVAFTPSGTSVGASVGCGVVEVSMVRSARRMYPTSPSAFCTFAQSPCHATTATVMPSAICCFSASVDGSAYTHADPPEGVTTAIPVWSDGAGVASGCAPVFST